MLYADRQGALIVKDGSIISDGYNGTPSGFENVCEYAKDKGYEPIRHKTLKDFDIRNHLRKVMMEGKTELVTYPLMFFMPRVTQQQNQLNQIILAVERHFM